MFRSRTFWQLFATYALSALVPLGVFATVVGWRADSAESAWVVWYTAAFTVLPALALAFWLAQRTASPLRELMRGVEQIAGGGYGNKVYSNTQDEVGKLARTFNTMSERLAKQLVEMDEDRKKLYTVLSSMVEGVVAIDVDQRILFANERAGKLLDFDTQAVGGHLWELVRIRPLQELVDQAIKEPNVVSRELTWSTPPARSLAVHIGRLPGQPPAGVVLVFHDISELRRLESVRQEFIANVSHELKTPLAVISACAETLLDGAAEDVAMRSNFLKRISEQAERLHALILDMLSLARLEAQTEPVDLQPVAVEAVVEACLQQHRNVAESKEQRLEIVAPEEPLAVQADEEAVFQILDNLIDNAIKYTPVGGTVRVHWQASEDQVVIVVSDTGIGIPESALSRIFERFYRVDKARSRELGGTGLGLSIVKHLAQSLNGSIEAESQLGKGSRFTVRLPRTEPAGIFANSSQNLHNQSLD